MKKIELDSDSNLIFHRLGSKGGPISLINIKEDIATHGRTRMEGFLLVSAMRDKGLLKITGKSGEEQVELTQKGKDLFYGRRG
ncbi:MAG: hypothetical protein KGH54_02690 [Candidatus Micrarchaeota archaeon]|nr:hypothetical protein [Candidatus Micrarchaeota archaeon]